MSSVWFDAGFPTTHTNKQTKTDTNKDKTKKTGLRRLRTALFRHIQGDNSGVGFGISIDLSLNNEGVIMGSRVKSS